MSDRSRRSLVRAEVPDLAVIRYTVDLRSISRGTATFTCRHLAYEPMPSHHRRHRGRPGG